MGSVKNKKVWKAADCHNECFNPLPVLQPAVLDPWDRVKLQMAERSYEKYALCKSAIIFEKCSR